MRQTSAIPDANRWQVGFTLIEALVVLLIIAVIMSLTVPRLFQAPDGPRLEAAARMVTGLLRTGRADAIGGNSEAVVTIDAVNRLISLAGHTPLKLPDDVSIHAVFAKQELRDAKKAGMRFFPDGSSTGGDVTLSLHGRKARISVNWLDGNVRLDLSTRSANIEHVP